ncbi:MAG: transglutaminase domain-containing protein [Verrucomicrobiaceae bacterium]|nr:MAG: transglutaminase domain-containing protein [Verrucomicrobiaceae bacterium]
MTNRPVTGIVLALLVESAHWTTLRWDFSEDTCGKVWKLTSLMILMAAVLIYLDGNPYMALPNLLTWLPPLLLPMQFVQSFGMADSLPLNTFSFLAKQRKTRNLRLGLTESVVKVNFGNIYFVATVVGSTLGSRASAENSVFLPGIVILTGWILLSASRSRPYALMLSLVLAGCIAVAGQKGINELEDWLGNRGTYRARFDPDSVSTMVGRPGPVDLSPEIIWRMQPQASIVPPKLLRTASYNTYRTGTWSLDVKTRADGKAFTDLASRIHQNVPYFITTPEADEETQIRSVSDMLPRFKLRGSASEETPLPLPGDSASLRDFELDGIEGNRMGTIRIFPKNSVIEGTVLWKALGNPEDPPTYEDTSVPRLERPALARALAGMGVPARNDNDSFRILREIELGPYAQLPPVDDLTLQDKLVTIREWFRRNFYYTRDLKIRSSPHVATNPTAITQFLTTERSGHCEYFATATTLLLREAGIPARYSVGYAVMERDMKRSEYIIRGTHGHAWCRVWDEENHKWIDFDTTPSVWTGTVPPPSTFMQRFNDTLKRVREDFFLWRNQPGNRLVSGLVMLSIGLGVAGFVFRRLWKSRRRMETVIRANGYEGPVYLTPLNEIERRAGKKLGPRPLGKPFAEWLRALRPMLPEPTLLDEALEIHQRLRFDPAPAEETSRQRLAELAARLDTAIKHA